MTSIKYVVCLAFRKEPMPNLFLEYAWRKHHFRYFS